VLSYRTNVRGLNNGQTPLFAKSYHLTKYSLGNLLDYKRRLRLQLGYGTKKKKKGKEEEEEEKNILFYPPWLVPTSQSYFEWSPCIYIFLLFVTNCKFWETVIVHFLHGLQMQMASRYEG